MIVTHRVRSLSVGSCVTYFVLCMRVAASCWSLFGRTHELAPGMTHSTKVSRDPSHRRPARLLTGNNPTQSVTRQ